MSPRPPLLYATAAYEYLQDELFAAGAFERGAVIRRVFPDGERYLRLDTDCAHRDVILIGGTISESDTLEIFDLACGLVECCARRLTLVIPFYGYSTMERATRAREVVTAKTRARLLSAVPIAAMGNRVLAVDLHVGAIVHYFEGGLRPVHVYAKPLIQAEARRLAGGDDFVLGCTDAGRAKWVESLANDMNVTAAFVYKRRLDGERTEVSGVSAHVRGRQVVIYDDMIRTGGSLVSAARAYREAGAARITAIATHGVFPGEALVRIRDSGLLDALVCTDTHPRARALADTQAGTHDRPFLRVVGIAGLLADRLIEPLEDSV